MKVYIPFYNCDKTEGRGPMVPVNFGFYALQDANDYIDEQPGIQNRRAKWSINPDDWCVRTFEIFSDATACLAAQRVDLKKKALAKLTDEEKDVLGLK